MRTLLTIAIALAVAGSALASDAHKLAAGTWGGQGIKMEVGVASTTFEFDCGSGSIKVPIALSSDGNFSVQGQYQVEAGSPARDTTISTEDDAQRSQPADEAASTRYSGKLKAGKMSLELFDSAGRSLGKFELRRGAVARLRKCM